MQKISLPSLRLVLRLASSLLLGLWLTACSNFLHVYKADLDQGNLITRDMVEKLKIGMSPAQVRYVLGTPLVTDTLNPNRWDYVYRYIPGTYARKAGVEPVLNRHLTVYFDNGVLSRIEGAEQMPEKNPSLPGSRDKTLNAEPL